MKAVVNRIICLQECPFNNMRAETASTGSRLAMVPNGQRAGLLIELSRFEPWLESLYCVLGYDTCPIFLQCFSLRCINR